MLRQENLLEKIGITEKRMIICAKELDECCKIEYEKTRIREHQENAEQLLDKVMRKNFLLK